MPGQYRKGAKFERQVKDFLEEDDWTVIRSAGSHTVSDLVAIKPQPEALQHPAPWVWLIQCKTDGRLKPKERDGLLELEEHLHVIPMLAYKVKGKIKLERVRSKEPTFHYEIIEGVFTKVGE